MPLCNSWGPWYFLKRLYSHFCFGVYCHKTPLLRATWGRKNLFHHTALTQEVRAGTQGKSCSRGHVEVLLTDLFLMESSACFIVLSKINHLWAGPTHIHPPSRKCTGVIHRSIWWGHFLNWSSLFKMNLTCVKLS